MYKSLKRNCQIVWRKGEPLGLAVSSTTCFLDLPLEIRNQIYDYALLSPRPITVSSVVNQGYQKQISDTHPTIVTQKYIIEGKDAILEKIARNLLFCHPIIAAEAAICFYRGNTFHFEGDEVWNPLYSFLQGIGDYNRRFLRRISIEVKLRNVASQDRYGARIIYEYDLPFQIVHSFARDPPLQARHPRRQTIHEYNQLYQVLDPAIQACFRLLGLEKTPILVELDLKGQGIPGSKISLGCGPSRSRLPDLPDFVESLRRTFAENVTVLWHSYGYKKGFEDERHMIEQKGWEIVKTWEEEGPPFPLLRPRPQHSIRPRPPHFMKHFTLRRTVVETVQSPPEFCESCYIQHP